MIAGVVVVDLTTSESRWIPDDSRARVDAVLAEAPAGAPVRLVVGTKLEPGDLTAVQHYFDDIWVQLVHRHPVEVVGEAQAVGRWMRYLRACESAA